MNKPKTIKTINLIQSIGYKPLTSSKGMHYSLFDGIYADVPLLEILKNKKVLKNDDILYQSVTSCIDNSLAWEVTSDDGANTLGAGALQDKLREATEVDCEYDEYGDPIENDIEAMMEVIEARVVLPMDKSNRMYVALIIARVQHYDDIEEMLEGIRNKQYSLSEEEDVRLLSLARVKIVREKIE